MMHFHCSHIFRAVQAVLCCEMNEKVTPNKTDYQAFKQFSAVLWPLGGASRLCKSCSSHWMQHCFVLTTAQIINQRMI